MSELTKLQPFLIEQPRPLIGAETIQLIIMREIMDYTVLRTEDTRELNTVATPLSVGQSEVNTLRVAFLGTKQKSAESRQLEQMLRTAARNEGLSYQECYLKDNLCLTCPRCALFGGTSTESGKGATPNIKHRIEYATAFSLLPFEEVGDSITFNAINDLNQTTGQALGARYAVVPASVFPSIVTLKSATLKEFVLAIKMLLACKSYGAESRIGGDVRNTVYGIAGGWEEVITPLELTLELYDRKDSIKGETVKGILNNYKNLAGNPDRVKVFSPGEVDEIVQEAASVKLDKSFIEGCYKDVENYRKLQSKK